MGQAKCRDSFAHTKPATDKCPKTRNEDHCWHRQNLNSGDTEPIVKVCCRCSARHEEQKQHTTAKGATRQ